MATNDMNQANSLMNEYLKKKKMREAFDEELYMLEKELGMHEQKTTTGSSGFGAPQESYVEGRRRSTGYNDILRELEQMELDPSQRTPSNIGGRLQQRQVEEEQGQLKQSAMEPYRGGY